MSELLGAAIVMKSYTQDLQNTENLKKAYY